MVDIVLGSKQTDQSIEGQFRECRAYAERMGYTIVGEYKDEHLTGTSDNRADFQRMIEDSNKKTFEAVLVYQLDRFSRNRYDSAIYKRKLKKNGVRVLSARENISDDASGVLMEAVLEGMAEYYSVELGQKVERGMKINASKCLYIGGYITLGFKIVDKKYTIDEQTSPITLNAYKMYDNDHTIEEVREYVNNQLKIIDKRNKKGELVQYSKGAIRNLLADKRCMGTYIYKDTETPNAIPQIVDVNLFNRVQERLEKNKQSPSRLKTTNDYILTTKLFCGHCKDMMVGICGTSRTGKRHAYYSCNKSRKKLCDKKNVKKEDIEDIVVKEARNILTDENINKIAETVVKLAEQEKDTSTLKRLQNLLNQNEKQKANLFDSLKVCDIDSVRKSIFEEMVKVDAEHSDIESQIQVESSKKINLDETQVIYFLTKMRSGDINDIKYRKMLITVLINKIYLYDGHAIIFFNTQDKEYKVKVPTIEEAEVRTNDTSAHQMQVFDACIFLQSIFDKKTMKGYSMNFTTNKEKGNSSLGVAIAYFTTNGYTVSIPLNDTQDDDLVVEKENKFYSIQVKSTGCKTKYGIYQVALKSYGGTKGTTYKTVIDTDIDYLFVVTDKIEMYLLPKHIINNKSTLNLCDKYQEYKVK